MKNATSREELLQLERIDTKEAARRLGVDQSTAYRWALSGRLEGVRVGGKVQITVRSLAGAIEPIRPERHQAAGRTAKEEAAAKKWADEVLDRAGI